MMITNNFIVKQLQLLCSLMELNDENSFKIQALQKAISTLEKSNLSLAEISSDELVSKSGVSKSVAEKVNELATTGSTKELANYLNAVPESLLQLFDIKGIGVKKIKTLWKEAQIDSLDLLEQACENNLLSKIKGFGEKTQQTILDNIIFYKEQIGKLHFSDAEELAIFIQNTLKNQFQIETIISGEVASYQQVISNITLLTTVSAELVEEKLQLFSFLTKDSEAESPFIWKGTESQSKIKVEIVSVPENQIIGKDFILKSGAEFLKSNAKNGKTWYQFAISQQVKSEEEIFEKLGAQFVPAEYRETAIAAQQSLNQKVPKLIEVSNLKGNLHNHSTYSDGQNTLEEMALACKNFGFEYFGIADHSKAAYWAGGLDEDTVEKQQKEIDILNSQIANFKIFKGIEADILSDGALDYSPEILKTFDYVVASIHQNLDMDKEKAHARLIKAIENPFTTILGHLTGRLLLKRKGYPLDHEYIIDTCVANKVAIELNADPWRLDMDWRYIDYAQNKGALISINPDAHQKDDLMNVKYGVYVARKGGLTAENTLNAMNLQEIENYFKTKKG